MGDLGADGGRQAIAHGAQPAGGQPAVGTVEPEELGRPHLVLAHLGGDDRIARAGHLIQPFDGVLGQDHVRLWFEGQALLGAPVVDLGPPLVQRRLVGGQAVRRPQADQRVQHRAGVADDGDVDGHVLVDRRPVDVDVDLLRPRREGIQPPGDPVVEPGADRQHDVAVVHGVVGLPGAVHAQHAQKLFVGRGIGAQAHQRVGHRKAGHVSKRDQLLARLWPGVDDAAAGIDDRPLGTGQQPDRLAHRGRVAFQLGPVGAVGDRLGPAVGGAFDLDILGQVDHDRARPAVGGNVKGLVDDVGNAGDVLDQIVVLGARPGDADGIGFLKGIVADQMPGHLAGQAHHGDGVHHRIGQAGDHVGRTRAGGDQDHARLAGRPRIAFRRVGGTLFVAHQDMADIVLLKQRVIDRQDRAARIAKDHLHTQVAQCLDDDLGARQNLLGLLVLRLAGRRHRT